MSSPGKTASRAGSFAIQHLSSVGGTLLSLYLLVQHTRLISGIQGESSFCALGKFADCDVVNASHYSEFLGIPIAVYGAAYYFSVFLISILVPTSSPRMIRLQRWIAWTSVVGLFIDVILLGVQISVLKSLCLFCLMTYVCTLGVFLSSAFLQRQGDRSRPLLSGALFLPRARAVESIPLQTLVSGAVAWICFVAVLFLLPMGIRQTSQSKNSLEMYFSNWKERPTRKMEVKPGNGTFGDPSAKVQIVEFSDFQCPYCKKAAFNIHTFLKTQGNDVHFVFKNYPLDNACNPKLNYPMHANACELARLGYCAAKAGKFWEYHDAVFLNWNDPPGTATPVREVVKSGPLRGIFTEAQYDACLKDAASAAAVADDISLGSDEQIKGTPSLFINGKLVGIPLTIENLKRLVEMERGR